jgi:Peptidase family S41
MSFARFAFLPASFAVVELYFPPAVTHFRRSMTRRFFSLSALALAALFAAGGSLRADMISPRGMAPDFKEVYELLRTNLPGATAENLNRAAVEALLSQFPGKVSLIGGAADGVAGFPSGPALSKSAVIESNVTYLRVSRVAASLADELGAAYRVLAGTNKIAGVVLDLRFADGSDDTAAQAAAKLFAAKQIIAGPLAVLVNGETRGAAEALAAALHQAGAGLIIGSPTAGAATSFKEFPLSNGERLRVAAASGGSTISRVQPDIAVTITAGDERVFFDNPYQTIATGSTNAIAAGTNFLPYVEHTSEADLVRQRQKDGKLIKAPFSHEELMREQGGGGDGDEDSAPARAAEPQKPVIRDPVLARAVDLIKGLAIVRESRP